MDGKIQWISTRWMSQDGRFRVIRAERTEEYDLWDGEEFVKTYLAVWPAMAEADRRAKRVRAA